MVVQVDVPNRKSRGHRGPAGQVPYTLVYEKQQSTMVKIYKKDDMAMDNIIE